MAKRVSTLQRQDGSWRPLGTYSFLCFMGIMESVLLSPSKSNLEFCRWLEYCNSQHRLVLPNDEVQKKLK